MILLQTVKGKFVFRLHEDEKSLLSTILDFYPRVTSAALLGKQDENRPPEKETQALLEEALADQRAENKRNLKAFLEDPKRFQKEGINWLLTLSAAETDWLLQILNDVRVGSWISLGSPESHSDILNKKKSRDFWTMEIAGRFQAILLEALTTRPHKQ